MSRDPGVLTVVALAGLSALPAVASAAPTVEPSLPAAPSGAWSLTGSLQLNRQGAPAVPLDQGAVLLCGGMFPRLAPLEPEITTCETWDPRSGGWRPAGSLQRPRAGHAGVRLKDGRVLFIAGEPEGTAEIWEPRTGRSRPTARPPGVWYRPQAVALADGRVLAWNRGSCSEGSLGVQPQLFDPVAETWQSFTGPVPDFCLYSAAVLSDGALAVAGTVDNTVAGSRRNRGRLRAALLLPSEREWRLVADIDFDAAWPLVLPDPQTRKWRVVARATAGPEPVVAYVFDPRGKYLGMERLPRGLMKIEPIALTDGQVLFPNFDGFILSTPARRKYQRLPMLPANAEVGTWAALPDGRLLLAGGSPLGAGGGPGVARLWNPAARPSPVASVPDRSLSGGVSAAASQRDLVLGPLAVTTGLCGGVVGVTYLTRQQPVSRGLSIASGAVGGTIVGAYLGYASADSGDGGGAILRAGLGLFGGALLGAVAGSLTASYTSKPPGAPRVATTAVSLSPIVIMAIVATVQN